MEKSRPSAIRIVTILALANGIILLVGGVITIYFVPTIITSQLSNFSNLTDANQLNPQIRSGITSTIISVIYIIASVSVVLGAAWFGLAWGLFTAKYWAWLITVILAIITIIFSILSIGDIVNITTLIISGVILYYMYRPYVKSYFGRVTIPK
jgi:hypothetical protein